MADVKVTARKNGPILVQGAITLIDRDGNEQELGPIRSRSAGAGVPRTSHSATEPRRASLEPGRSADSYAEHETSRRRWSPARLFAAPNPGLPERSTREWPGLTSPRRLPRRRTWTDI